MLKHFEAGLTSSSNLEITNEIDKEKYFAFYPQCFFINIIVKT